MTSRVHVVGGSSAGIDAPSRVNGGIDFVVNLELPRMAHACIKRSPFPHARINAIDSSRALSLPGVFAIATADSIKGMTKSRTGRFYLDQTVLATDRVRFVGDPVAAVAAADAETAAEACDLIDVDYEELPAVFDIGEALASEAPVLHSPRPPLRDDARHMFADLDLPPNVCSRFTVRDGDVERALDGAHWVMEEVFETPPVQHVPLETHVTVASYDGRLTLWSSTQMPHAVRALMADLFNLPNSSVRVIASNLGGGFGAKGSLRLEPITTCLAILAGRPVKLHLSREEEFLTITRHASRFRITSGVDTDGAIVARKIEAAYNTGAYSDVGPMVTRNAGSGSIGPYRIPNVSVESLCVWTNLVPAGAFRGFGVVQSAWAYESHMDSLARHIGMDPVEFRHRNFLQSDDRYMTGETVSHMHMDELLDRVVESVEKNPLRQAKPGSDVRVGRGYAAIMKATISPSTSMAALKVNRDGSVIVLTSSVDLGQGVKTVLAQLAADRLQVSMDRISVTNPDTDTTPYDQQTSSSRTTFSMGNAVIRAADDVICQLKELAGAKLDARADELSVLGGGICVGADPTTTIPYANLVALSGGGEIIGNGKFVTSGGLDPVTGRGVASVHWHQGAVGCEVEVDVNTGKVVVRSLASSVFAGRVVNPTLAELQLEGSLFFGLGQALFEKMDFDDGQLTNPNLSDYLIPSFNDMPSEVTTAMLEDGEEMHGVGETVLPPVSPAIANAVFDAAGVRIRQLPLAPEAILRALEDARDRELTELNKEKVTV